MAKNSAKTRAYLNAIKSQIAKVVPFTAATAANYAFEDMILSTSVDSGQALAQWYVTPYQVSPSMMEQQILWGSADSDPVYPVGYKYTRGANADDVADYILSERALRVETLAGQSFTGIMVYNPVTPGFSGFTPGDDTFYADNSFANVDLDSTAGRSLDHSYAAAAREFDFVRVV